MKWIFKLIYLNSCSGWLGNINNIYMQCYWIRDLSRDLDQKAKRAQINYAVYILPNSMTGLNIKHSLCKAMSMGMAPLHGLPTPLCQPPLSVLHSPLEL